MLCKLKILNRVLLASPLLVLIGGCASSQYSSAGSWDWAPPPTLQAGNAGSSGAVIASPVQADTQYYAYAPGYAPENFRRDESLNIREGDPYAGWMGFPEQERVSLEYQRTYNSSTHPDRYRYPTRRKSLRHYDRRSSGRHYSR